MLLIPDMPFYWRFKERPDMAPGDPPARVPFVFDYDASLGLFIEPRTPELMALLTDIYGRDANVGFLQEGHTHVASYGADFWRFMTDLLKEFPVSSAVEIGCGGCVLLKRLKDQGCKVLGVDPSPVAVTAGRHFGIDVIPEFFQAKTLPFKTDLIFQVDVLEHVGDPVAFLREQIECLTDNGLIVVNVPNCTGSLERGDISTALHQHVNMYDEASLRNVFISAGLEVVRMESAKYGSALYAVGRRSTKASMSLVLTDDCWVTFERKANRAIAVFADHVTRAKQNGSVGFFMPQRAFPYLSTMKWFEGYRLFDNMNVWHQRYLDGVDIAIENQADLVARPVDHVFIMSLTFGEQVATALRRDVPAMKVTTLEQMLAA